MKKNCQPLKLKSFFQKLKKIIIKNNNDNDNGSRLTINEWGWVSYEELSSPQFFIWYESRIQ